MINWWTNLHEFVLIGFEHFLQPVVDVRPIPEGPHVDLGHLRTLEGLAKGPHQSPMNPHQLGGVDRVRFVEDDPELKKNFG